MSYCVLFDPHKNVVYRSHILSLTSPHFYYMTNLPVLNSHLSHENFLLLRDGSFDIFRPDLLEEMTEDVVVV